MLPVVDCVNRQLFQVFILLRSSELTLFLSYSLNEVGCNI